MVMYNQFFGFKESPFKLVPNPRYLYLSKSHEEALGHLNYAIRQGDGFVTITGEVGTGKTTLCRVFLENLDDKVEAAYIFNPKLDARQLLQAVCDEFGISSPPDSIKGLTDRINAFLIDQKRQGRRPILLIDEAQNLSAEVLEQLRLLSNLETTSSKLIQIILVGQPELGHVLSSYELRQLAQRVTLSCNLFPLSQRDTGNYIRHRLQIASHKSTAKLTPWAVRRVYAHSGGIPRRINIYCDRALLVAFTQNRKKVTAAMVRAAAKELSGIGTGVHTTSTRLKPFFLTVALGIIFGLLLLFPPVIREFRGSIPDSRSAPIFRPLPTQLSDHGPEASPPPMQMIRPEPVPGSVPQKLASPAASPALEVSAPSDETVSGPIGLPDHSDTQAGEKDGKPLQQLSLENLLTSVDNTMSRYTAIGSAIRRWQSRSTLKTHLEEIDDDLEFFRLAAKQNGLLLTVVDGGVELLKQLNLPAILEFYLPGKLSPLYLTVRGLGSDAAVFALENRDVVVPADDLDLYWTGVGYVLWKNFYNYTGVIPVNAPRDAVLTLKMHLKDLGADRIKMGPGYDATTRQAVKDLQSAHGLEPDGIVGPLTKIVLYNKDNRLQKPALIQAGGLTRDTPGV
jgi:general secretion pathway protein A